MSLRPDDEDKPFVARWNLLMRILLVESSVKNVGRVAMDYADFQDGTSCHPSNKRLARETGYDESTVRNAWAILRALGLATRVRHGVPHRGIADEYELNIPDDWERLPTLGPRSRAFTCLYCGKDFDPAGNIWLDKGTLRLFIWRLCFCRPPRKRKGRDEPNCFDQWDRERQMNGEPMWRDLDEGASWKMVREARGDDW